MSRHWRRRTVLKAAGATFVGSALSACSSHGPSDGTDHDTGELSPVTLNLYVHSSSQPSPGDDEVFSTANKIIKHKINAKVNFHMLPGADYRTKMPTQLAAGNSNMDLLEVGDWLFGYATPAQQGAFTALDDLLAHHGQGILNAEPKSVIDAARIDGKVYAVSGLQLLTLQPSWLVQRRVLDASGVKAEESQGVLLPTGADPYAMDVIRPILAGAKQNLKGTSKTFSLLGYPGSWGEQAGFDPLAYGLWPITPSVHSQLPIYVKMGTSQATLGLDEIQKYATMMRAFYKAGYMKSDAGTNAKPPPQPREDVGVRFGWTGGGALSGHGTVPEGVPEDQAYLELPLSPVPYYMGFNTGWAIPATSKHPERAMMLMNLLFTNKELLMLLAYGIKGRDYAIKDGTVEPKTKRTYTHGTSCWVWGNCFLTPTWPYASTSSLRGPKFWSEVDRFLKAATVSPLSSFVFDQTPVSPQWASLNSATAAHSLPLFTGATPVTVQFQKYQAAVEAAGANAILKEVQKQLDVFLRANPDSKQNLHSMTYDRLMALKPVVPGK